MIRAHGFFLVGLVCVAACRLDFVGPESTAAYDVVVRFTDSATTETSIEATLSPGFTSDGDQRNIPDDAIRVWNMVLNPKETDDSGERRYEANTGLDPRRRISAVVSTSAPPIDGILGTPSDLAVNLVWRTGLYSITVLRTTDLVLGITNAQRLGGAQGTGWTLTVRERRGAGFTAIFRTASLGLPPPTLRVPAELFATTEATTIRVELAAIYATASQKRGVFPISYRAELTISANLHWTVTLLNP